MSRIDFHTHLFPPCDEQALRRLGGSWSHDGSLVLDGKPVGPPELCRPDLLEEHLEAVGLDEAVVAIPPPCYRQHLEEEEAARWVAMCNDCLLDLADARERLVPLAYLPFEHPALAMREYERLAASGRLGGVAASAGGLSADLDSPALADLLSALNERSATVVLHPGGSPDRRLERHYLANLIGNPMETTIAASQLLLGGCLESFQHIRFVLVHAGGCLPALLGRIARGVETARPGLRRPGVPVDVLAKRFFADCLAHHKGALDLAIATFGADKMLLGSDWPFPMGAENPWSAVEHLPEDAREAIATTNALQALGRRPGP